MNLSGCHRLAQRLKISLSRHPDAWGKGTSESRMKVDCCARASNAAHAWSSLRMVT